MSPDPLRRERNQRAMQEHELDALVCRLPENVLVLTGYWPISSATFAVVPREGNSYLIAPDTEIAAHGSTPPCEVRTYVSALISAPPTLPAIAVHLRDILGEAGLRTARIGYEGSFEAIAPGQGAGEVLAPAGLSRAVIAQAAPEAELADATSMLNWTRACKTPSELAALRRANQIAALGIEAFRSGFRPGRRECEVAAEVEAAVVSQGTGYNGARYVRAWAHLMSGAGSAASYSFHPASSTRAIEPGDLGVLEMGTSVDGYWSDLTRTLVAGSPAPQQKQMYASLEDAHRAVRARARTGMTGGDVDALARDAIAQHGFRDLFLHQTGHGLGFRYHELHPILHPRSVERIEEGMVSSVEPGLYLPGFGGMRLEDNVVFTANGVDLLSEAPTSLVAE